MTPDTLLAWSMLAAFFAGAGITIVLARIADLIAAAHHLLQHFRHRPNAH
jgi:hypothetical protein